MIYQAQRFNRHQYFTGGSGAFLGIALQVAVVLYVFQELQVNGLQGVEIEQAGAEKLGGNIGTGALPGGHEVLHGRAVTGMSGGSLAVGGEADHFEEGQARGGKQLAGFDLAHFRPTSAPGDLVTKRGAEGGEQRREQQLQQIVHTQVLILVFLTVMQATILWSLYQMIRWLRFALKLQERRGILESCKDKLAEYTTLAIKAAIAADSAEDHKS